MSWAGLAHFSPSSPGPAAEEGSLVRFQSSGTGLGTVVHLRRAPGFWLGSDGVGTGHHVAFRAASEQVQLDKRAEIEANEARRQEIEDVLPAVRLPQTAVRQEK